MTCHECQMEIGDHVDGTLPPARAASVEAHLATCSGCAALAADLRAVRAVAATLERHTPPPKVWTRLVAEIHAPPVRPRGVFTLVPGLNWRSAVAAGVLVSLVTAGTWFSWHEVSTTRRADRGPDTMVIAGSADSNAVEEAMRTQISDMEQRVQKTSAVLPDETQAAYKQAGAVIDDALNRRANGGAGEMAQQGLLELLRSKLTLLQEMIALINEMRKGNQEEAARIVSGMEQ